MPYSIEGLDKVVNKMDFQIWKLKKGGVLAITKAAIKIKRDAQEMTPVDWGNLRDSAFIKIDKIPGFVDTNIGEDIPNKGPKGEKLYAHHERMLSGIMRKGSLPVRGKINRAEIGFTMPYSAVVHETHKTQSKFLEKAFKMNQKYFKDAMQEFLKIR